MSCVMRASVPAITTKLAYPSNSAELWSLSPSIQFSIIWRDDLSTPTKTLELTIVRSLD